MTRILLLAAVLAAALFNVALGEDEAEANSAQAAEVAERKRNFVINAEIFHAKAPTKPVGFERTRKAIKYILDDLDFRSRYVVLPACLAQLRREARDYKGACDMHKDKCPVVLEVIDWLRKRESRAHINLGPYLDECKRRQEQFCSELENSQQPCLLADWFGKLTHVCNPQAQADASKPAQ